jgi:Mitochondrial carrier protein
MTTDRPNNVGVRKTPAAIASRRDKPMYSLIAGATAGAVEGLVTYPIEYTKTVAQFTQRQGEKVRLRDVRRKKGQVRPGRQHSLILSRD